MSAEATRSPAEIVDLLSKVMPAMLSRVERLVPMPELYDGPDAGPDAERDGPADAPMIDDVVPLVTDPPIAYLRADAR